MAKLRVKNFGPIQDGPTKNDGWFEFKKVTIFIGNQGSGKSSIAKLFATFSWIEKALVRGNFEKKWFERKNRLKNQFLEYHRLENYLQGGEADTSEIEYEGDAYSIKYLRGQLSITEVSGHDYSLPQIMYVPAERNFISYVRSPKELKLASDSLKEFLVEFDNAKAAMKGSVSLPINDVEIEYDKLNDILNVKDNNYRLRLTDASSGFQSVVPLYLVSWYLSKSIEDKSASNGRGMSAEEVEKFKEGVRSIYSNNMLSEEQKRVAVSALSAKFNNSSFINIVEEPEQNLFPISQWQVLQSLLEFNNQTHENKLVLTTHSPYIVNFMSIAVQGWHLYEQIKSSHGNDILLEKLKNLISIDSLVKESDLVIYELDEKNGSAQEVPLFEGVPSDHNYLNDFLRKGNQVFDQLLEIEEEI